MSAHLVALVGFFLPWVDGAFGSRADLSGFALAGMSRSLGTWFEGTGAAAALYALPVLATDGLLISVLGDRLPVSHRAITMLTISFALPATLLAVAILVFIGVASRSSAFVDGPGYGLYVESVACVAIILLALGRFGRGRAGVSRECGPVRAE